MKHVCPAVLGLLLLSVVVPAQGLVRERAPDVSLPRLRANPRALSFGAVSAGETSQLSFTLRNKGGLPASIDRLALLLGPSGTAESYTVDFMGGSYVGGAGNVSYALNGELMAGGTTQVDVTFAPTLEQLDDVLLRFSGNFPAVTVMLSGLGGHEGDPYLHVVIEGPDLVVDYDGDGSESVILDGTFSHTHEPGYGIVGWTWSEGPTVLGSMPVLTTTAAVGPHTYQLEIADDNVPPGTLAGTKDVTVVATSAVPGVLARYYDASGSSAAGLLDAIPLNADFGEVLSTYDVAGSAAVGGTSFTEDVMVWLTADFAVTTAGTYDFALVGGAATRLELDGAPIAGPQVLGVGSYELEARFAVDDLADLPLGVTVAVDGGAPQAFDPAALTHDQSGLRPIINTMPTSGLDTGGNPVTITGLGFFPAGSLTLHWGGQDLTEADFTSMTGTSIAFVTPPGPPGPIAVTVETPAGTSNQKSFLYQINGPVPIVFVNNRTMTVPQPTSAAWGPDGRLYVTAKDGRLTALSFDESWALTSFTTYPGVSGLTNPDTLGIAFNPWDPPSPVRVYVSHSKHFVDGGQTPTAPSPYTGQVSVLEGPAFDSPVPLITGLPTSNHDHAMNAIEFDHNGDLLICVGSNTNAGIAAFPSGDLPESPLSAAILKARTSDPGFDGTVEYLETVGGVPNDDQRFGEDVDVSRGDVVVHAAGLRNPYDMVLTTSGHLYALDNGPNFGFGPASTSATTQGPDPYDQDELLLIERGNYYGHPHRGRGRTDDRQNVYYPSTGGTSIPETFTQALGTLLPAACGIDEYRSDTFQGQMRGDLVAQKWGSNVRRLELSDDGRSLDALTILDPFSGGLGLVTGPGGVLIALDYQSSRVRILEPDDLSANGLVVHDITPWRAPAQGGAAFVIGGVGFGTLGDTSVTIGGLTAALTAVSATRIEGVVPAQPTFVPDLLDVEVTVGSDSDELTAAFRYLDLSPGLEPGRWETRPDIPAALGEVAAGVIDGVFYVVGSNDPSTWAFDLVNRVWLSNPAARPYPGHHHAAEVHDGKLYLFGGLDHGSEGKVQIYDPVLDAWTEGTDMPWAGSSVSTALIDGLVYVASGITSGFTTTQCGIYDPALDSWSPMAPMPDGRNHAAAATDGSKLWIFGGRKGGNFVQNGFADVFVYDPQADAWDWTGAPGTSLTPMVYGRGGMGKAVWMEGEFYVFGGETLDGPGATPANVFDRVDVYDPATSTWRLDRPMPEPRHGVFPVLYEGLIHLAGGGQAAGTGWSSVFDVFNRQ